MKFLTLITLVVGYFVYLTYQPYLLDIAIAALMAIAFLKIENLISKKIKNRYILASIVTLIFMGLIFGPLIYFILNITNFLLSIKVEDIKHIISHASGLIDYLPSFIASKIHEYVNQNNIAEIYNSIVPILGAVTKKGALFFKDVVLIVIFFFFAILYGREILNFFKTIIPFDNDKLEKIFFNTSEVMSVVFYSTMLTAILEGVLFGIVVSFYGMNFIFFTIMYAFFSLIPVVGGVLMWAPVSLYLYANGNTQGALVVAVYSILIISILADTFIKPLIIKYVQELFETKMEINSMIIFFAIVAGLSSFGMWGMIIGPAVTAMFISILQLYKEI